MDGSKPLGEMLVTALSRANAAALVLLFGSPDAKRPVERLIDGKLSGDEAQAVRDGLDRLARKFAGEADRG